MVNLLDGYKEPSKSNNVNLLDGYNDPAPAKVNLLDGYKKAPPNEITPVVDPSADAKAVLNKPADRSELTAYGKKIYDEQHPRTFSMINPAIDPNKQYKYNPSSFAGTGMAMAPQQFTETWGKAMKSAPFHIASLTPFGAEGLLANSAISAGQSASGAIGGNIIGDKQNIGLSTALGAAMPLAIKGLSRAIRPVGSYISNKLAPVENKAAQEAAEQIADNVTPQVTRETTALIPQIKETPYQMIESPQGKTFSLGLEADGPMPYADGGDIIPPNKPPVMTVIGDELPVPVGNNQPIPETMSASGGNIPPKQPPVATIQAEELPMNAGNTGAEEFIYQGQAVKGPQKVRKTYKSLETSKFGDDPEFMENIEPEKMYETVNNKDTFAQAMGLSSNEADNIIKSETPSALRTMTNIKRLGDALDAEDQIAAQELGNTLLRRGTEMGQSIQAYSLIKKLSPEGAVLTMLRVNRESTPKLAQALIDNADEIAKNPASINAVIKNAPKALKDRISKSASAGTLTKEKYLNEIDKFYKTKGITTEDIQKAKDLTSKIQSSTGREQEIAIGQLRALISSKKPVSLGRKISTVQTMAQLMNPKTITRNIIGNSLYQGLENATQIPATLLDKGVSKFTGQRSIALPNLKTQLTEGLNGAKLAAEDIRLGIDTSGNDKFDLFPVNTFKNPVMNALEKGMNYSLRVPDRFAYEGAKADILAGFKKLGNEITPEIEAYAEELARKKTFQDDSALAKAFSGIKEKVNFGQDWGVGDLFLKYAKTPANLISRGLSYSPAGLVKGVSEVGSLLNNGQVGDLFGVAAQNKAVGDVARGAVGSGILGGGYVMAKNGLANGGITDNDIRGTMDLQANQKLAGNQPYSLRFGNNTYTYDWAQPTAIPFSAGVNMADNDVLGLAGSIAGAAGTVTEQPLFQGVQNLANNLNTEQNTGKAIFKTLADIPASFTPGILNQTNQLMDNNIRETYDPNVFIQGLNKVKSKIPGLAQTLPIRPDVTGKSLQRYQDGSNNPFNVLFNPGFSRSKTNDPVISRGLELYKTTGETSQLLPTVKKSIVINGQNKQLSAKEYVKYQSLSGKLVYDELQNAVKSGRFNNLPEDEQVKVINNIQTDVNAAIKYKLFGNRPKRGLDKYAQRYLDLIPEGQ